MKEVLPRVARLFDDHHFIAIPYKLLALECVVYRGVSNKFSVSSKMLFSYLAGFEKAFPSMSQIAKVMGITKDGAKKSIDKLVDMGLLTKVIRAGHSNIYNAVIPDISIDGLIATIPTIEPLMRIEQRERQDYNIDNHPLTTTDQQDNGWFDIVELPPF